MESEKRLQKEKSEEVADEGADEGAEVSPTEFVSSAITTSLRGLSGIIAEPAAVKPEKLLVLYEFEGCPYCRLVREALTELDLDAEIHPCPKRGQRFRPVVRELGGKYQFPFLHDPNTGVQMYESLDIVAYLYATYGERELPLKWRFGGWHKATSMAASGPRINRGMVASGWATLPWKGELLELYSFEASPFARPVRETLCELEIPYQLRSCGRNRLSEWIPPVIRDTMELDADSVLVNRVALQAREGRVQIPFLYDPNSAVALFESDEIIEYLEGRYGA